MSNNYKQQFYYSYIRNLTGVKGQISIASGTNGVSSTAIIGATAARTAVGEITITLGSPYNSLIDCQLTLQNSGTVSVLQPQIKSADVSGAKTIVVNLVDTTAGTKADPAAAIVLHVNAEMKDSSVTY